MQNHETNFLILMGILVQLFDLKVVYYFYFDYCMPISDIDARWMLGDVAVPISHQYRRLSCLVGIVFFTKACMCVRVKVKVFTLSVCFNFPDVVCFVLIHFVTPCCTIDLRYSIITFTTSVAQQYFCFPIYFTMKHLQLLSKLCAINMYGLQGSDTV